uniref:Uncharacterized protein n=1 Tax=Cacopsylla melanoneura TaxID=428564 RepID=A0A8D8X8Y6_9HEMI
MKDNSLLFVSPRIGSRGSLGPHNTATLIYFVQLPALLLFWFLQTLYGTVLSGFSTFDGLLPQEYHNLSPISISVESHAKFYRLHPFWSGLCPLPSIRPL